MPINAFALTGQPDPYSAYAESRHNEPVHQSPPFGIWNIMRYDDAMNVLRRPEIFSSDGVRNGPAVFQGRVEVTDGQAPSMLMLDPPDHTRLRALVSRAFTPRMVAQLEPRIREIARELLDAAEHPDRMDVINEYAYPLPVIVISEILGVPPEDRADFKRWSNALVAALGNGLFAAPVIGEAQKARDEFVAYFRKVFEQRRADPRDDLVSNLLKLESEGDALTPEELMSMCILLLVAGNETTTNLIGNAVMALTKHPEAYEQVERDPALIPSMLEEVLRYYPPVQMTARFAREPFTIDGKTINPREVVMIWLASANRDEAVFPDAEQFIITRDPNRHISFGLGIHFCLGAPLARLEAKVAMEELLARRKNLRAIEGAPVERIQSFIFYGVRSFQIANDLPVPASA